MIPLGVNNVGMTSIGSTASRRSTKHPPTINTIKPVEVVSINIFGAKRITDTKSSTEYAKPKLRSGLEMAAKQVQNQVVGDAYATVPTSFNDKFEAKKQAVI